MALCSSPVSHILRSFDENDDENDDLARANYTNWSVCMKNYLLSQDLWGVIEASSETKPEDSNTDFKTWRMKNAAAFLAIQNSCESDILSEIKETTSAKNAWDTLAKRYESEPLEDNSGTDYSKFRSLYEAIRRGDWSHVKSTLDLNPDAINAKISYLGRIPLHVACIFGHLKMVENLVELMSETDLVMQDEDGYTALTLAARSGTKEIAEFLVKKKEDLVTIRDLEEDIPLTMACTEGRVNMTRYLYSVTPLEFFCSEEGKHGSKVLKCLIDAKMFGKYIRPN